MRFRVSFTVEAESKELALHKVQLGYGHLERVEAVP